VYRGPTFPVLVNHNVITPHPGIYERLAVGAVPVWLPDTPTVRGGAHYDITCLHLNFTNGAGTPFTALLGVRSHLPATGGRFVQMGAFGLGVMNMTLR